MQLQKGLDQTIIYIMEVQVYMYSIGLVVRLMLHANIPISLKYNMIPFGVFLVMRHMNVLQCIALFSTWS